MGSNNFLINIESEFIMLNANNGLVIDISARKYYLQCYFKIPEEDNGKNILMLALIFSQKPITFEI